MRETQDAINMKAYKSKIPTDIDVLSRELNHRPYERFSNECPGPEVRRKAKMKIN